MDRLGTVGGVLRIETRRGDRGRVLGRNREDGGEHPGGAAETP
jgi:hypothetical protein